MRHLASVLLMVPLALLCLCAGCGSNVRHNSRSLTCLGFCAETDITHKTDKPIEPEPVEPKKEP